MVQCLVHLLDMDLIFGRNLSDSLNLVIELDVDIAELGAMAENVAGEYPEADFGHDN